MALTATATEEVYADCVKLLQLRDVKKFQRVWVGEKDEKKTFNRPNLRYEVCEKLTEKDIEKLKKKELKDSKNAKDAKDSKNRRRSYVEEIVAFLHQHPGECGIVYVLSRQDAGGARRRVESRGFVRRPEIGGNSVRLLSRGLTSAQVQSRQRAEA